jgi:hypothetical protein
VRRTFNPRALALWQGPLCSFFEAMFNIDELLGKWKRKMASVPVGLNFRQALLVIARAVEAAAEAAAAEAGKTRRFVILDKEESEVLVIDVGMVRVAVRDAVPLIEVGFMHQLRQNPDAG